MLHPSFASRRVWCCLLLTLALVFSVFVSSSPISKAASPSNGRIAFQRVFWDAQGRTLMIALFTVAPDGSDLRQLTDPPPGVETGHPDWSPDGLTIAYMRVEDPRAHVVLVAADGTGRRDLTKGHCPKERCQGERDPTWSPDGARLAFVRTIRDTPTIFVMHNDGTHRRRVMDAPRQRFIDSAPAWSPDGHRLVFARVDQRRGATALFVVSVDDARPHRITRWNKIWGFPAYPDWSPDGTWILFHKRVADGSTQLFVIHPDGTGLTKVTHTPDVSWSWGSFSPDGTMIAAIREPGEAYSTNDVYVMGTDGSVVNPITGSLPRRPDEGHPDWGPAA
jgi:Tol biopolymer transport system component